MTKAQADECEMKGWAVARIKCCPTLTKDERTALARLYKAQAFPWRDRAEYFGWNWCDVLRSLADLQLVEYRDLPHQDGEMAARLTERGVRSYLKGLRRGVQS